MAIPVVLKDFIRKHIINHFYRYVQHLDDENIEKTSNKIENYYRQTNPEKIKKIYKTKNGILTFLDYQMENWTEKHIKIKYTYKILQTPFSEYFSNNSSQYLINSTYFLDLNNNLHIGELTVLVYEKNFPDVYRSKVRICSPNKIADPDFWSMWQKWRVYA